MKIKKNPISLCQHCACVNMTGRFTNRLGFPSLDRWQGRGGEEGIGVGVAREALGAGGVWVVRVAWGAVGVGWADGTGGVGVVREA